jgi:PAS domain S-box-containing protein
MIELNDSLIEQINSLIVVVNQNGKVEYVNPFSKKLLGYDPHELLGDAWWALTRIEENDREHDKKMAVQEIFAQRKNTTSYERKLFSKQGELKWVLWNTTVAANNTLIGIGQDITAQKNTETLLQEKNNLLLQHTKDIEDSIACASRIQQAFLPNLENFTKVFSEAFVVYEPKDIVSGDCYFFHQKQNKVFVAAVDCTGHGVPGAMMSVIANNLLTEVIVKKDIENPTLILQQIDTGLQTALNNDLNDAASPEGMDIALAVFDFDERKLYYAGAFRTVLFFTQNELRELPGSRYPIGFYQGVNKTFETHVVPFYLGDSIYLFSDGYCDQFGGDLNKKFNRKRFKELLLSAQEMNLEEQGSFLAYALRNWRQDTPQTDDVLVIGLRV